MPNENLPPRGVSTISAAMLNNKIQQLAEARRQVEDLEASIAQELQQQLAGLPKTYGFKSVSSFCAAVSAAVKAGASPKSTKRRKRSVVTPAIKAKVKKLAEAGKTGAEIVEQTGVSIATVQNIKKGLGLVRARGEKR